MCIKVVFCRQLQSRQREFELCLPICLCIAMAFITRLWDADRCKQASFSSPTKIIVNKYIQLRGLIRAGVALAGLNPCSICRQQRGGEFKQTN